MTGSGTPRGRRYGLAVHANIATVASFSPIGERADWYWSHLDQLPATAPHASPLAEVLAHHADRWSHIGRYDDFLPLLGLHRFDADEIVDLAASAGVSHVVQMAKHRDGFCWWDASGTTRTSLHHGPRLDVLGAMSEACRRHDLGFGAAYSLIDWSDPRSASTSWIDDVVAAQVLDLVERYGVEALWTDAPALAGGAAELIDQARDIADAQGVALVINDRWDVTGADVRTIDRVPDAVNEPDSPAWELCRPLGSSPGHNRAERAEHVLSAGALLDLLTEVVAKGGNLTIDVGLGPDGTVSDVLQHPLRAVGRWVDEHRDIIHASRPFAEWGDAQVRYAQVADEVIAVDLAAGAEVVLTGLAPDRFDVSAVVADDGAALHWEQHRGGVAISRIDRSPAGLAGVYRVSLRPAVEAIRLFEDAVGSAVDLDAQLRAASPGEIVQLADGAFRASVAVPDGVVLRGLGWDRTTLLAAEVTLGAGSGLENVHVSAVSTSSVVTAAGARGVISGCHVDGRIDVSADDVTLRSVVATEATARGCERVTIERSTFKGDGTTDVGLHVDGGSGHRLVRIEVVAHRCAIRCHDVSASTIAENRIEARWWGVHLVGCDAVDVNDNQVQHTMRAVDVDGGNSSNVTANWIADGDSGALVQFGATETVVADNHVERCRLGVLVWDAPSSRVGANTFVDIHEEAPCAFGPDADT